MALLEKFATVDVALGLTPDELNEKVKVSDALIIRSATQVTKAVFDASAGRLKVVGRAGVGVDNVDLGAATAAGCLVVNAPTANTVAAAEHGIALLTAVARNVAQADASIKAGRWDRSKYVGVSMVGKTLAVIGFGKVGSEVGRRGRGLGFNVVAYDPYASEAKAAALGVKLVSLDDALATADFFSLHMPMTPETKGLFNDALFAKMKRGARVVNVARGGVIDDAALVRALDAGIVAAAALDVFEKEPPPPGPPPHPPPRRRVHAPPGRVHGGGAGGCRGGNRGSRHRRAARKAGRDGGQRAHGRAGSAGRAGAVHQAGPGGEAGEGGRGGWRATRARARCPPSRVGP
jgi:D-3-phosphoglycerate dehydrogenase